MFTRSNDLYLIFLFVFSISYEPVKRSGRTDIRFAIPFFISFLRKTFFFIRNFDRVHLRDSTKLLFSIREFQLFSSRFFPTDSEFEPLQNTRVELTYWTGHNLTRLHSRLVVVGTLSIYSEQSYLDGALQVFSVSRWTRELFLLETKGNQLRDIAAK